MKAQVYLRNSFLLLSLAWMMMSNPCMAQQLKPETNWLNAWKSFAGNQVSAQWIHNQVADGAQILSSETSLLVHTSTDWNSMEELTNAFEEGIQDGGSNQMMQSSDTQILDSRRAITTWQGTLGGRPMYAVVAAQLGMNGNAQLVISLSQSPVHPSSDLENHEVVVFMSTLDGSSAQQLARGNE